MRAVRPLALAPSPGSLARQPSLASPHPAACSAPAPPAAPGSRPCRLVPPTGPAAPRPARRRIGRAPVCGAQPPGPGGGPGPDEAPRGARGRTRRVQGVTNGVSACSPSPGALLTPTHPNPAEPARETRWTRSPGRPSPCCRSNPSPGTRARRRASLESASSHCSWTERELSNNKRQRASSPCAGRVKECTAPRRRQGAGC